MASATPAERRAFPSITECDPSGRESHAAAADLDGTLLVSRSSFPYFFLLAVEASSLLRGLALLVLSSLVLAVYKLVYVAVGGLRKRDVELVARAVLPRFYAADVRADSWAAFRACGRRREVVTANPTVMVEAFAREFLGADEVLGTELEVDGRTGWATGRVASPGVLVGRRKREAGEREFGSALPELGLGDRESDRDFMALCKVRSSSTPSPDTHPTALSLSLSLSGTVAQRVTSPETLVAPDNRRSPGASAATETGEFPIPRLHRYQQLVSEPRRPSPYLGQWPTREERRRSM